MHEVSLSAWTWAVIENWQTPRYLHSATKIMATNQPLSPTLRPHTWKTQHLIKCLLAMSGMHIWAPQFSR